MTLDKTDKKILNLLQQNCKLSSKEIAKKVGSKTSTVYAKIQRMEKKDIIKKYSAVLNNKKLGKPVTAIIHASFKYHNGSETRSQRDVAKKIAKFPEVQDLFIVSGDWDMIMKTKAKDAESAGNFVVDKLRKIEGIGRVVTSIAFATEKETLNFEQD